MNTNTNIKNKDLSNNSFEIPKAPKLKQFDLYFIFFIRPL